MKIQDLEVFRSALPLFDRVEGLFDPGQALAARRTPTAAFLGVEVLEVVEQSHRAGLVVEDDHRARAETASGLLDVTVVHRKIEVFVEEKRGRCATGQKASELHSVRHPAGRAPR